MSDIESSSSEVEIAPVRVVSEEWARAPWKVRRDLPNRGAASVELEQNEPDDIFEVGVMFFSN